jgi:toxin CcdB
VAQLDVYRTENGEYLLDYQADLLDHFNTRFVIPLASPNNGPKVAQRLNPIFPIDGEPMALYTQFALTVPAADLKHHVTSLSEHHFIIRDALDMLISGY